MSPKFYSNNKCLDNVIHILFVLTQTRFYQSDQKTKQNNRKRKKERKRTNLHQYSLNAFYSHTKSPRLCTECILRWGESKEFHIFRIQFISIFLSDNNITIMLSSHVLHRLSTCMHGDYATGPMRSKTYRSKT